MQITRSLDHDGTLGPAALNYLAGIPLQHLFFVEQQSRHPASIYTLSLAKLNKAFVAVADGYAADTARFSVEPKGGFDIRALLEAQEHLLRCLQEHLADCYLILKTFVDPATTKARTFNADQYVVDSKLPGAKSFIQAIDDYKSSLVIANKLKHNQGRLRGVGIYPGNGLHLGYFLEEPDKGGVLGPSPEIHPDQGAFSFARDLKWRLFLVYSLSESLVKALGRALMGLHQVSLERTVSVGQNDDWNRLIMTIAKIPFAIFPKELAASVATVQLVNGERQLSMKFPDRVRVVYPSLSCRAVTSTTGDGFSRQFKVPLP